MSSPGQTLGTKISDRIAARPDSVWTASDFLDLGSRAAVDKALQRLVARGELRRIDRGLYDRPRVSALTGQPRTPDPRAVLDAIARRDQIRLLIDGATAANDLGLTNAVPARIDVLTDARLRPITLGHQRITFRQAAPSRLYWAGRPAMRVVQALHWLHDVIGSDDAAIRRRLRSILLDPTHGTAIRKDLFSGMAAMPIWMQSIVRGLDLTSEGEASHTQTGRPPRNVTNKAAVKGGARHRGKHSTGKVAKG